jgi:ribosome assembly protein YihI (activator of Der GTPase)
MRPAELNGLRIEEQVHEGGRLEELANRIGTLSCRGQEFVEVIVDRLDHLVEARSKGLVAFGIVLPATR